MKLMLQIGVVFAICLTGEWIGAILPFPFPSSIVSMILLFVLLLTKWLRTDHIEEKGDFLLKNMAFFFIPSGVAIMDYFQFVQGSVLKVLLICAVTTILTFATTAYTILGVMALQRKWKGGKEA